MSDVELAHSAIPELEIRLWAAGKPVRHRVLSMDEAIAIWARSGTDRAILAMTGDDGPPWPGHPPTPGLFVTTSAGEACRAMAAPDTAGGKRPGDKCFSRRIVDVLIAHPGGIRRRDLVAEVSALAGCPIPEATVRQTLWKFGRRDPANPNVWTTRFTAEDRAAWSPGRVGGGPRSGKSIAAGVPESPEDAWDSDREKRLRVLAAVGRDAAQIAALLGRGLTEDAVLAKGRSLGVQVRRPGR